MSYPVIVTYANFGFVEFAENFLINVSKNAPNHSVIFYCLDEQLLLHLKKLYSNSIKFQFIAWYQKNISSHFLNYGTEQYNQLLQNKLCILKNALKNHEKVLYLDCDVVFLKEPDLDFYQKFSNYDMVFQSDSYPPTAQDDITVCAGIMIIKNSLAASRFIDDIIKIQEQNPNNHDQECMYIYFMENNVCSLNTLKSLLDLNATCAPWNVFMAGIYVLRESAKIVQPSTYLFHANFVVGKMRKMNLLNQVGRLYLKEGGVETGAPNKIETYGDN